MHKERKLYTGCAKMSSTLDIVMHFVKFPESLSSSCLKISRKTKIKALNVLYSSDVVERTRQYYWRKSRHCYTAHKHCSSELEIAHGLANAFSPPYTLSINSGGDVITSRPPLAKIRIFLRFRRVMQKLSDCFCCATHKCTHNSQIFLRHSFPSSIFTFSKSDTFSLQGNFC